MRGVRIIAAIDLAGNDDSHRRLKFFHGANLHRRSVRAQQQSWRAHRTKDVDVKRVHVVAHGMKFGNVEGFEIVIRRFDFGAFDDGEADGEKMSSISWKTWRIKWCEPTGRHTGERKIDGFARSAALSAPASIAMRSSSISDSTWARV